MSDYSMPPERAFWLVPVAAAFALLVAARDRRGDDSVISFADQAVTQARQAARTELRRWYRIIPTPDPAGV